MELLQVWESLYRVISSVAEEPEPGTCWGAVLIDFDLASRIEGTSSGSPDKTGTPTFMPVGILTSSRPVRHQELYEDEAAFWIGFLAIISRVESGRRCMKELQDPALSMSQVGIFKRGMLHQPSTEWNDWFGEMGEKEGSVLRRLCEKLATILFFQQVFPGSEEVGRDGKRLHLSLHLSVVDEILRDLGVAVRELAGQ
ncbi:MAG: hypothetical protein M1840_000836 [Geoglossum simile]|nr:MAG: hypothetical protein M1840_000836 [Geoglossum simile]